MRNGVLLTVSTVLYPHVRLLSHHVYMSIQARLPREHFQSRQRLHSETIEIFTPLLDRLYLVSIMLLDNLYSISVSRQSRHSRFSSDRAAKLLTERCRHLSSDNTVSQLLQASSNLIYHPERLSHAWPVLNASLWSVPNAIP
jgi:hypothetical protein